MPIYEGKDHTLEKLEELRKWNICKECGEFLNIFLDIDNHRKFLACNDWHRTHHEGIVRQASEYQQKGLEALSIPERRKIMEQQYGEETTKALAKYHGVTSLTKPEALEILQTVYPKAPDTEIARAVLLCTSYGFNPLMGHVFLIPFEGKEGKTWATVLGIKAKRLAASRRGSVSYVDDTPRLMTEEEQLKIFGKIDNEHIVAITKLRNPATGAEVSGYGKWKIGTTVYGMDKGNSAENMAFIRSESQALDRLFPGEMPVGVEVIDEAYSPKSEEPEIVEGEVKEVEAKPEEPKTDLMNLTIKNLGDLFSAAHKHFGMSQRDVLKELGGIAKEDIADVQDAWQKIVAAKT